MQVRVTVTTRQAMQPVMTVAAYVLTSRQVADLPNFYPPTHEVHEPLHGAVVDASVCCPGAPSHRPRATSYGDFVFDRTPLLL